MRRSPNGGSGSVGAVIMTIAVSVALVAMINITGGAHRPLMASTAVSTAQPLLHPASN